MTSPLRRAREEVAVNIAVTGFVARTLGTQTQKYARQLEGLEVSAKGNRQESRRMKEELSLVRAEGREGSDAWRKLTKDISDNDAQHKIIQTDIQSTRLAQRRLQVSTGESLAKIRGFGIVLGVATLALGGASGAVIKLSGNMQELNTIAFQTNTTVQDLQFSARRFGVILGDPDMGKAAAVNLANIKHQIDLISTGMSNMDLGNLAMAGINYSELLGKNIEQIRAVFLRQLRASQGTDVASLRRREAIRQQVGGETYTALVAELKSPDRKYNFNAVSEGDIERLGEFRKEYGAIRIGAGQFAEVLTLSLVPAIGKMFSVFSRVTRAITGFVLAHRTTAIVIGTVVVVSTALIGILSGIFVIAFSLKLAFQGLVFIKTAWIGITRFAVRAQTRLAIVMASHLVLIIRNTVETGRNAAVTGIARTAHAGWAVIIGILTFAKTGLSIALVRNNVLTTRNGTVTGIARMAHAGWAIIIGVLTFAKTELSIALVKNSGLTLKNAVAARIARTAHAGWAVTIGVLTFAKTGLSIALVRNNVLTARNSVLTGAGRVAHAGWAVIIGVLTFAKTGLSIALVKNNVLTVRNATVIGIARTAHAGWAVTIGVLTFAKTGLSIALVRNNVLTARNAVLTGAGRVAHAGWIVIIGVVTFAQTGLSVALVRSNALMVISIVRTGAIAVIMGVVAIATGAWIIVTKAATVAQIALNIALWANPIGLIVAVIVLAIAALGGAAYAMFRWRNEILNFFDGWRKAVLLVLGPIALLAEAIIIVIQNWNKLKNLGPFSSDNGPSSPGGGEGWWGKATGAVVGGLKEGWNLGAKYSPSRLLGRFDQNTATTTSRQIGSGNAYSGNINNRTVNVREQMDINNTFNINGAANTKEVAAEIADRQHEANSKNISFRDVGFALE